MPSSDEQADPLAVWLAGEAATAAGRLEATGSLYEQQASMPPGETAASMASVAGEKDRNEDAVLMWVPPAGSSVRWAAAVADGVSACFHPQLASRLACAVGLADVCENAASPSGSAPVQAAQRCFDRLATLVQSDPDAMRPAAATSSMWKRVVRDGAYAQTTLIVLWQDDAALHIEGVGDGGLLVEVAGDLFEYLPGSNRSVRCLGPGRSGFQVDYRLAFPRWSRVAAFTDGMTPWVRDHVAEIFLRSDQGQGLTSAEHLVGRCLRETNVRDNVSLFLAEREAA